MSGSVSAVFLQINRLKKNGLQPWKTDKKSTEKNDFRSSVHNTGHRYTVPHKSCGTVSDFWEDQAHVCWQMGHLFLWLVWNHLYRHEEWNLFLHVLHVIWGRAMSLGCRMP